MGVWSSFAAILCSASHSFTKFGLIAFHKTGVIVMPHWELLIFFFAIACIYASVGFGGGSSYLAILALYHFPFAEMKLTALLCNIIVVTGGTMIYIWRDQVNWRKVLPLV